MGAKTGGIHCAPWKVGLERASAFFISSLSPKYAGRGDKTGERGEATNVSHFNELVRSEL